MNQPPRHKGLHANDPAFAREHPPLDAPEVEDIALAVADDWGIELDLARRTVRELVRRLDAPPWDRPDGDTAALLP